MVNTLKITVDWVIDDNPDLEWLGEYITTRPVSVAYVDRKNNILIMPEHITKEFSSHPKYDSYCDYVDNLGLAFDDWEDEGKFFVEHKLFVELPFTTSYGYRDMQFVKFCNYENPTPDEYQYIFSDLKELEDYNNNGWYMRGCVVKAFVGGIELAKESLWGLSSTMDESEDQEVIDDLTFEVTKTAKKALSGLQSVVID